MKEVNRSVRIISEINSNKIWFKESEGDNTSGFFTKNNELLNSLKVGDTVTMIERLEEGSGEFDGGYLNFVLLENGKEYAM